MGVALRILFFSKSVGCVSYWLTTRFFKFIIYLFFRNFVTLLFLCLICMILQTYCVLVRCIRAGFGCTTIERMAASDRATWRVAVRETHGESASTRPTLTTAVRKCPCCDVTLLLSALPVQCSTVTLGGSSGVFTQDVIIWQPCGVLI